MVNLKKLETALKIHKIQQALRTPRDYKNDQKKDSLEKIEKLEYLDQLYKISEEKTVIRGQIASPLLTLGASYRIQYRAQHFEFQFSLKPNPEDYHANFKKQANIILLVPEKQKNFLESKLYNTLYTLKAPYPKLITLWGRWIAEQKNNTKEFFFLAHDFVIRPIQKNQINRPERCRLEPATFQKKGKIIINALEGQIPLPQETKILKDLIEKENKDVFILHTAKNYNAFTNYPKIKSFLNPEIFRTLKDDQKKEYLFELFNYTTHYKIGELHKPYYCQKIATFYEKNLENLFEKT